MPEEEAKDYRWNPFDLTKVWLHSDYPLIDVGVLELNKNPSNYFADVEQAAFAPSNIVPGISFSPDKMLQARIFSYADAQRYRLGVNYQLLPVNRPRAAKVHNYQRDGYMRFDGNTGNAIIYEPNSFGGPTENPTYREPPLKINGDADKYDQPRVDADFEQPGMLFRLMTPDEQQRLIQNIVGSLSKVPMFIQERMVKHFLRANKDYGKGVAKGLGIST
jgi:catalase